MAELESYSAQRHQEGRLTPTMQTPVIEFKNVSKTFIFNPDRAVSLKQAAVNFLTFRKFEPPKTFAALKDISFKINQGEFVGILGRNGAGKSTILKIMAKVLAPGSGEVITHGRVAPLIELGAGFHPDLSGYENIFLNGSIIGLTKEDVYERIDRIIEFSELREFIEMPVRQYSSGMFLRLGFSIAVHTSPDILLVDEVLAVGDFAFQKKCKDRIREMNRAGTTVILISHLSKEISDFCERCILIEDGLVSADGPTNKVLDLYLEEPESRDESDSKTDFA
jgi:ABC-type polysaccharide/polyol phosphate transport system ATPase subunit